MLDDLSPEHRQLLFRFLCSFAWADGEVADAERRFVHRLMGKVKLRDDERLDVDGWLDHPPNANDVQPGEVPLEHRHLFVDAMRAVIFMDGKVTDEEEFRLEALRRALSG
jgi:hypothetical protein